MYFDPSIMGFLQGSIASAHPPGNAAGLSIAKYAIVDFE
jgi:hypothetical protein